jgi:diacylglycerol kinase family enzyme
MGLDATRSADGRASARAEATRPLGERQQPGGEPPSVRRRMAAGAALLAFLLAIAVAVATLGPALLVLPLVVLGVAVAVVAGWTALVCRGRRRVIGAAVAVLALAASLVLLGVHGIMGMAIVAFLVAAAHAAGRAAVPVEAATPDPAARRVDPAEAGVLLVNPRSGRGREGLNLEAEAERLGVRLIRLRVGESLAVLAERAIREGADVLGVAGGDGSQAVVADVARRYGVAFVCVPAGTRNHFALDLGLDVQDVPAALCAFSAAVERRVDLATVGERIFVNNASIGVYGSIVQAATYRRAKLATTLEMLPELLGPQAAPPDLRFQGPDGRPYSTTDLLLVSNNPYAVEAAGRRIGRPRLDQGVLGIVVLRADPRDPGQEWTAHGFVVDSSSPVPVGLDGEAVVLQPPLEFRILPGALRVRLPVAAPGASARLPEPGPFRTAAALLRVVAGRPHALR